MINCNSTSRNKGKTIRIREKSNAVRRIPLHVGTEGIDLKNQPWVKANELNKIKNIYTHVFKIEFMAKSHGYGTAHF